MQLILNTKCHAIRDLQLSEKEDISKECEEEQVWCVFAVYTSYVRTFVCVSV